MYVWAVHVVTTLDGLQKTNIILGELRLVSLLLGTIASPFYGRQLSWVLDSMHHEIG